MKNKVIAISKQNLAATSSESITNTAKNIQYLMRLKGMDAEGLREATGLGIATVNSIRRGEANPTLSTLEVIAQVFQVTVSELVEANLSQGVAKNKSIKTMPLVNLKDLKNFIDEKFAASEQYSTDIQDSGNKSYFAVHVNNDTLSPQFPSGTVLVIGQDEEPCDGDFVLVQMNSNTPCFRKLFIEGDHFLFSSILFQQDTPPSMYKDAKIIGVILKSIKTISGR